MKLFFVDFEASSLDSASVPIEIAWVNHNGQGEGYLIKPEPDWTNWSLQSQKVHKITRPMLWSTGKPADWVARHALAALRGATLVSDNPAYDSYWLAKLFSTIYDKTELPMINFDQLISAQIKRLSSNPENTPAGWYQHRLLLDEAQILAGNAMERVKLGQKTQHRALPDATHLWLGWKAVCEAIDRRVKLQAASEKGASSETSL